MAEQPFAAYQNELYLAGLSGQRPQLPVGPLELEHAAAEALSPESHAYVAGGAGSEHTMAANLAAFDRHRLVPRHLRDTSDRDLSVTVCGAHLPAPLLLDPVGVLGIVHDEAELAVARAASALGVPTVLSTVSSYSLEQVAEAAGDGPRWFQLYWPNNRELTESLVRRAEAAGYSAIVATVDTTSLAWRPRDLDNAYLPFLQGQGLANYFADPVFRSWLDDPPEEDPQTAILHWVNVFPNPGLSWDDLGFLRQLTDLPVLLKGVVDPEDARRAADAGADGVIVSNHGGRQVDGAVAALDALTEVVGAVGARIEVLFDSGVRTGADVLKALALGARAVLVGRPYVWGLALGGETGVTQVVRSLLADLDISLGLTGYARLAELGPGALNARPAS
jgi:isopentenyl diphosphate isomerase/L-lactate dehydrogenase-like FMN-dependent dehydrogenase